MRTLFIILIAILLGGGGTYLWVYYGGFDGERTSAIAFIDAYSTYDVAASRVEDMVHGPGTKRNPDRTNLLALLEKILTADISAEERSELARVAYGHLDSIQEGIADAKKVHGELYAIIQDLDNTSRIFHGVRAKEQAEKLVTLARERAETSARIIANLSETHEYTYAIITRVLEDGGELTDEHKNSINTITAEAESRHAALEEQYARSMEQSDALEIAFDQFVHDML